MLKRAYNSRTAERIYLGALMLIGAACSLAAGGTLVLLNLRLF